MDRNYFNSNVENAPDEKIIKETTIIYDGPAGKIVVPHTPDSSAYWGTNTDWWYSSEESDDSGFRCSREDVPTILYFPALVTDTDRESHPKLSSFGVISMDKRLYDERTKNLFERSEEGNRKETEYLPAPLRKLISAAWKTLAPGQKEYLHTFGQVPRYNFDLSEDSPLSKDELSFEAREMLWRLRQIHHDSFQEEERISKLMEDYPDLCQDKDVMVEAMIWKGDKVFVHLPDNLRADKSLILSLVYPGRSAENLERLMNAVPESLRADRDFIAKAREKSKHIMKFASDELRSDLGFNRHLNHLEHLLGDSLNDRLTVDFAVSRDGTNLQYASEEYRKDKNIVSDAGQNNYGQGLQYAHPDLLDDKDVIMAAVFKHGPALKYASERLKADKDVVGTAIHQRYYEYRNSGDIAPIECASESLRGDKEFMLEILKLNPVETLRHATKELLADKEFALAAIAGSSDVLGYFSEALRDDEEIVLPVIEKNGIALEHASKRLQSNKGMATTAVTADFKALKFVDKSLLEDRDILLAAIENLNQESVERRLGDVVEILPKQALSDPGILHGLFNRVAEHSSSKRYKDMETVLLSRMHNNPLFYGSIMTTSLTEARDYLAKCYKLDVSANDAPIAGPKVR